MWLLDTDTLIKYSKQKQKHFKKDVTYTTIFSLIEFPIASRFKNLTVIYPSTIHYKQAYNYAVLLREKGTPIPTIDILIGTISIEKNQIIVTDDAHFFSIQNVDPRLKIIDSNQYLESL